MLITEKNTMKQGKGGSKDDRKREKARKKGNKATKTAK
jgi:hypothetical protein